MMLLKTKPNTILRQWSGLLIAAALLLAFGLGLLIQPSDSQANLDSSSWQARYFDNPNLQGQPVLSRYERTLSYNWSEDAPLGLPPDHFSARWMGTFDFTEGTWRFVLGADDGVRLWVDDELVIDQWQPSGQYRTHMVDVFLEEGEHSLKVEYFDETGLAGISLQWNPAPPEPDAPPPPAQESNTSEAEADTGPAANGELLAKAHIAFNIVDVYSGPGIQYPRLGQVYLYQRFEIQGQNADGSWLFITLRDGRPGWLPSRYVFRTGPQNVPVVAGQPVDNPVSVPGITRNTLRLRHLPAVSSEVIDIVPRDQEIIVIGRSSNSLWYLVRYQDVRGWLFAPGIELTRTLPGEVPFVATPPD